MARVSITSETVISYLEDLAAMGIYGSKPGSVATWIVRKEIMRLVERGVLRAVKFKGGEGEGDEED